MAARRVLALGLGAVLYIAIAWWIFAARLAHPHLLALAAQHLLLLPPAIWLLRRPASSGRGWVRLEIWLAVYLAGAVTLGYWRGKGGAIPADESAWSFQARIFAAGTLTAEAPATVSPGFEWNLIHHGRWFTQYPPGWPAILALGQLLHIEWLVNPLLGLLVLILTHRLGLELFDEATARAAVALCVLSPYFLFDCVGYLSHTLCAVLIAAALLCCFRGKTAIMLAFIGAACLVRPGTGVAAGMVLTGGVLWSLRSDRRGASQFAAMAIAMGAATVLISAVYNHAVTGNYWQSPYSLFGAINSYRQITLDLREIIGTGLVEHARRSMEATAMHVAPFFFLLAVWVFFKETRRLAIVLPALLFLSLIAVQSMVPIPSASSWGERYYFEAFAGLAVLAARGWVLLKGNLAITAALVVVQVFHFTLFVPPMMARIRPYVTMRAFVEHLPYKNAVVFLADSPDFTAKHFNMNAAEWKRAPILYLVDPGPARRQAAACGEQRAFWAVLTYDGQTDSARLRETGKCDDSLTGNIRSTPYTK